MMMDAKDFGGVGFVEGRRETINWQRLSLFW
jgi:hypothetical protein